MASKELEAYHIKNFLSKLFDKYKVLELDRESPDCIVQVNNNNIGIEHTLLRNEKLSSNFSNLRSIINNAQIYFEKKSSSLINVKISFTRSFDGSGNRNNKSLELAHLVELLLKEIPSEGITKFILDRSLNYDSNLMKFLPSYIESISIEENSKFKKSLWQKLGAYQVPQLTKDIIQKKIDSKTKKLNNIYLNYHNKIEINQYWLLMVIEGLGEHSDWTSNPLYDFKQYSYNSNFDRIFIFSVWKNSIDEKYIHELKITK